MSLDSPIHNISEVYGPVPGARVARAAGAAPNESQRPKVSAACTAETIAMENELLDEMEETDPVTATETHGLRDRSHRRDARSHRVTTSARVSLSRVP